LSWAFWRGCGAILALSSFGFGTLVSGSYKNNTRAPAVDPRTAFVLAAVPAVAAFVVLWRWEHRGRARRR
jgi:hypothetical protein